MPIAQVAIVGRPNVGKSSLLNRLAKRRVSIVDPTPGVTRDRVSTPIEIPAPIDTPRGTPSRLAEITDTGGYGVYTAEGVRYDDAGADLAELTPAIETQIRTAWATAQLILFIVDGQAGPTTLDETVARLLREQGGQAKVVCVANKVDGESWIPHGLEAASLGFGEPVCVSATNGFGFRHLLEMLYERVETVEAVDEPDETELKIAIVGKRNAGKSRLVNALAGEPRVIVSEIAGTTRDAVDVRIEIDGRRLLAIDTAGVRKRKSFSGDVEYYAYHRMLSAIRRSDLVVLLVDATRDISQVDKKLALELQRQYKPTIIAVNKTDLVDRERIAPEDYLEYLTQELRGLQYAPIVFISAAESEGLEDLVAMAFNLNAQGSHRVATGELNRIVKEILARRGPSSRLGTQAKLYYASQVDTHPPTLVLTVNSPQLFEGRYERYLMNRLREEVPFSEVPIRLVFTERSRVPLQELRHRPRETEEADPLH